MQLAYIIPDTIFAKQSYLFLYQSLVHGSVLDSARSEASAAAHRSSLALVEGKIPPALLRGKLQSPVDLECHTRFRWTRLGVPGKHGISLPCSSGNHEKAESQGKENQIHRKSSRSGQGRQFQAVRILLVGWRTFRHASKISARKSRFPVKNHTHLAKIQQGSHPTSESTDGFSGLGWETRDSTTCQHPEVKWNENKIIMKEFFFIKYSMKSLTSGFLRAATRTKMVLAAEYRHWELTPRFSYRGWISLTSSPCFGPSSCGPGKTWRISSVS